MSMAEWTLFGIMLRTWITAMVVGLGTLAALWIVRAILVRRFLTRPREGRTEVGELVGNVASRTVFLLMLILCAYAGALALDPRPAMVRWLGTVALIALLVQIGLWGDALVTFGLARYQKQVPGEDGARITTVRALTFLSRLVLFTLVLLLALDNIPGVEVTALIASLGVGGIAVALAVQSILADLFASLSIALDKPFVIGDFIIVGEFLGTVEHVGLKTTRLRSLSGEQLVFSNNDLLGSRIRNFQRMHERRILFTLGVTYQTPYDQLRQIPALIREIIEAQAGVRFDRVHFKEYGAFSLNFEIVYYVLDPSITAYLDAQQAINLALYQRFEAEGIEFAYPTQTIFVEQAA